MTDPIRLSDDEVQHGVESANLWIVALAHEVQESRAKIKRLQELVVNLTNEAFNHRLLSDYIPDINTYEDAIKFLKSIGREI